MKINRRMIRIALACLGLAVILTFMLYSTMKKTVAPEPTVRVAYFKTMMEKDTIVKGSDVVWKDTPVSLVPKEAIRDTESIKDKRLLYKVSSGEMVMPSKLLERGEVLVDVKELWTIGLDVVNLSNYLGGNIREGKNYALLYRDPGTGDMKVLGKVKVAGLVDATGRVITNQGDATVKTVNVSVEKQELLKRVAKAKGVGNATFELVDAPEGKEIPEEEFEISKPNTAK